MATKSDAELYREKLLGVLKEEKKPLTIAELAVKAQKRNLNTLRRQLNWLAGEGQVIKLPGRGASFTYKYRAPVEREVDAAIAERPKVAPNGMATLLRRLTKSRWESATTKSSRAIPYCVRKLYEYASDTAFGGTRTQQEYNDLRAELRTFHDDLVNSLATVRSLLDTEELWDAKKSASWLLRAGGTPAEYSALANEVQEMQK